MNKPQSKFNNFYQGSFESKYFLNTNFANISTNLNLNTNQIKTESTDMLSGNQSSSRNLRYLQLK